MNTKFPAHAVEDSRVRLRQARPELLLLLLAGLFFGITGPFGTASEPMLARHAFWIAVILTGGAIGFALDVRLRRWFRQPWSSLLAAAAATTPPVTMIVLLAMIALLGHDHDFLSKLSLALLGQVFVISLAVLGLRRLVRRPAKRIVETRTISAPPLPEAEAAFRVRLSAKHRSARLLAVEAHDHYLRVHTEAGVELISMRISEAVAELREVPGFRVHRSWWVSAGAIRGARWRRASGELELDSGLAVPVSRSGAPALRAAGWL